MFLRVTNIENPIGRSEIIKCSFRCQSALMLIILGFIIAEFVKLEEEDRDNDIEAFSYLSASILYAIGQFCTVMFVIQFFKHDYDDVTGRDAERALREFLFINSLSVLLYATYTVTFYFTVDRTASQTLIMLSGISYFYASGVLLGKMHDFYVEDDRYRNFHWLIFILPMTLSILCMYYSSIKVFSVSSSPL